MIYLIFNEYYNRGTKTIELRNEFHDTLMVRLDDDSYNLGQYVFVDTINNKPCISHEVDRPDNFLKFYNEAPCDLDMVRTEIELYVSKVKSENLKMILSETVCKSEDFYLFPAAKTIHHAYIGGLAHHSLNMLKQAEFYASMYDINMDILIAGCLLHDYGKIYELADYGLTYTIEGNLLGHISMCYEEVSNIAINLGINNDLDVLAVKHCILSHHGQMAYGSPKEPMTIESYVLSQIDEIDAKIDLLKGVLKQTKPNKISAPVMAMDRRRFIKLWEE